MNLEEKNMSSPYSCSQTPIIKFINTASPSVQESFYAPVFWTGIFPCYRILVGIAVFYSRLVQSRARHLEVDGLGRDKW